jgi:hypothetical protein
MNSQLENRDSGPEARSGRAPKLGERQYFLNELVSLRDMWGYEDFWINFERANATLRGLGYVYMNTIDLKESDIFLMVATCDEFNRRAAYALVNSIPLLREGQGQ